MTHGAKNLAPRFAKEDQGIRDRLRLHQQREVLTFIIERSCTRTSRLEAWLDSWD